MTKSDKKKNYIYNDKLISTIFFFFKLKEFRTEVENPYEIQELSIFLYNRGKQKRKKNGKKQKKNPSLFVYLLRTNKRNIKRIT